VPVSAPRIGQVSPPTSKVSVNKQRFWSTTSPSLSETLTSSSYLPGRWFDCQGQTQGGTASEAGCDGRRAGAAAIAFIATDSQRHSGGPQGNPPSNTRRQQHVARTVRSVANADAHHFRSLHRHIVFPVFYRDRLIGKVRELPGYSLHLHIHNLQLLPRPQLLEVFPRILGLPGHGEGRNQEETQTRLNPSLHDNPLDQGLVAPQRHDLQLGM